MQSHTAIPVMSPRSQTGKIAVLTHSGARQAGDGEFGVEALTEALRTRGLDAHVIELQNGDDAAEAAKREALAGAQVVVAVGGDGTVRDIATGLWRARRAGSSTALGILPAGTMNNLAATLGVSEDRDTALDGLASTIRSGQFRLLDLAQLGDTIFIEEAGFGILSPLARIGESVKRNEVGLIDAMRELSETLKSYQAEPLTLWLDGRRRRVRPLHVSICNAPVVALRMNVAPRARMDDGLLDVVVYERFRPLDLVAHLLRRIGGRDLPDARVRRFRARTIIAEPGPTSSMRRWPIEVDGEAAGEFEPGERWNRIEIRVLPRALTLAAPRAPERIKESAWKTLARVAHSTMKRSTGARASQELGPAITQPQISAAVSQTTQLPRAAPKNAAARTSNVTLVESTVKQAMWQATEPPEQAAKRTSTLRWLYLIGSALALIAGTIASRTDVFPGDLAMTRALQRTRTPRRDRFWKAIAWAGFPGPSTLVISLSTLTLWLARFRLEAIFLLLATGVNVVNFVLKRIVRRQRPAEPHVRVHRLIKEPSFPSGHVMFYVSALGFLAAAATSNLRPSMLRRGIVSACGWLIALVGPSRIYLGAHWPSDVGAGYLFGGLYLGGLIEAYTWAKRRQARNALPVLGVSANELAITPDTAPTSEPAGPKAPHS